MKGAIPTNFPDDFRRELLVRLAALYGDRTRLFKTFIQAALGRLASGGLADTINELLRTATQDELLDTLLTLVDEGSLTGCTDEALRLAADPSKPRHARVTAVRAVCRVGSPLQREALVAALVDDSADIDHDVAGALIGAADSPLVGTPRLLLLLSRVRAPPKQTGTVLPYYLGHTVYGNTPKAERQRLLAGILELVSPPEQKSGVQRSWLLEPLARLAVQHGADDSHDAALLEAIVSLFERIAGRGRLPYEFGGDEIRRLVACRSDLRRALFWQRASQVQGKKANATRFRDLLGGERLWELCVDDVEWLERDARTRSTIQERLLAFDCLVRMRGRGDAVSPQRESIARLVKADERLATRLRRYDAGGVDHEDRRWEREQRVQEAKRKRARDADHTWLLERLDTIRCGDDSRTLTILAREAHLDPQEPQLALKKLAEDYDASVAAAAGEGWRRSWKRIHCPLPHEEDRRNTFSYSMVAGFGGLTLDIARGVDVAAFTDDEARQAARYATRGMNRFPGWLDGVVEGHPGAVVDAFSAAIAADFSVQVGEPDVHCVLDLLARASNGIGSFAHR